MKKQYSTIFNHISPSKIEVKASTSENLVQYMTKNPKKQLIALKTAKTKTSTPANICITNKLNKSKEIQNPNAPKTPNREKSESEVAGMWWPNHPSYQF